MRTPDSVFPSRYSRDRFPEFQATRCSPQVRFLRFARFEPTIADKTLRLPLLRFVILGRFLAKLSQKLRTSESRYFVFDRPRSINGKRISFDQQIDQQRFPDYFRLSYRQ
jgi:hypothetical protein